MVSLTSLPLELVTYIIGALSLRDILYLMRTSKANRVMCRDYLRRRYTKLLRPYIDHQQSFRAMLRHTRSVISGSSAVAFGINGLMEQPFAPSDLDVYTNVIHGFTVVEHLRQIEGYHASIPKYTMPTLTMDDYHGGIATVMRLVHPTKPKIDIICSTRISALHPLCFFWSTIPMTYLTADGFCTAYPDLFFSLRGFFNPTRCDRPKVPECTAKYIKRGFTLDNFTHNESPPFMLEAGSDPIPRGGIRECAHVHDPVQDGHPALRSSNCNEALLLDASGSIDWNCPYLGRRFGDEGSFHLRFGDGPASSDCGSFPVEEPLWKMGGISHGVLGVVLGDMVVPWAPVE